MWGGGGLSFTAAAAAAANTTSAASPLTVSSDAPSQGKAPLPHRLAFTDWGFAHKSTDSGRSWDALYVRAHQRNPIGATTPVTPSWESNGLMDTTIWGVGWANASRLLAWCTDIRGTISTDGGSSMSFNYTGHPLNTMYRTTSDDSNFPSKGPAPLFAATSAIHDLYQSTHLTDAILDSTVYNGGRVLVSTDFGATFSTMHDFHMPVVWVTVDETRPGRLYAAVVNSEIGGIYVADGAPGTDSSAFKRLSSPPRTQGHPYNIVPLPDGALVVSYSGRMDDNRSTFFSSSGIFYLESSAACLRDPSAPCDWSDRSSDAMRYWTKDIVVDPLDPSGDTWFACVFTEFGLTRKDGQPTKGGLYRSTDRGLSWSSRLDAVPHDADGPNEARVESITIIRRRGSATANCSSGGASVYLTTEGAGLWYSAYDPLALNGGLNFTIVTSYPFHHPIRVVQNPHNLSEVWVGSFGNGLYLGVL
jgi:hypothetical protein